MDNKFSLLTKLGTPEPEQIFLKYSLMIGLSLLVVFMGSIAQIEMLNQYVHNVVNETN